MVQYLHLIGLNLRRLQYTSITQLRLLNKKKGEEKSYYIVSDAEANFKENKISVNTPIAKGLLGKKVGDIAEIQVPAGTLVFEILEITR